MKKVFVIGENHKTPWVMNPPAYPELTKHTVATKDGKPILNVAECERVKKSCEAVATKGLPLMWLGDAILPVEEEGSGVVLRIIDAALPGGKVEF